MVVYLILYGAGVLFASSAHYYMSGMSLILAALYLYFYDYRRSGNPLHLRALFSLFWVGGEGISCFKLSRLQTDWDPVTWASFFIALAAFWSVFGLAEARIRKKREEGKDKREEKARRKGVEAVSEGTEAAGSFGMLTAILLLTAVSWAAFLLEAAVLGYVPFFLRGVPHAYSHFHISGVHYFTVSCVLVPSMAVIWFLRGGVKKRWQAVLVLLAAAASLLVPVLCSVPVPADLCGDPGGADFYAGLGKEAAAVSVRSGCGAAAALCDPDCCQEPRCGVSQRYF